MRLLRIAILLLSISAGGITANAQDKSIDMRLHINDFLHNIALCTPENIQALSAVRDDFQSLADEIPDIASTGRLRAWVQVTNTWIQEEALPTLRYSCDGAKHLYFQLDHSLNMRLFDQVFGYERAFPQDDAMHGIRELLDADLAAIAAGEAPAGALLINRVVTELPECRFGEAFRFHQTVGEFEGETRRLLTTPKDDAGAIREWAARFEDWARGAWTPFYEYPCGEALLLIHFMETVAFSLAIDWVYYDEAAETLDRAIEFVQSRVAIRIVSVEGATQESR